MQLEPDELIRINHLKVTFPLDEGTVQALDGIDLSIGKGKVIGVVGGSGCGKEHHRPQHPPHHPATRQDRRG